MHPAAAVLGTLTSLLAHPQDPAPGIDRSLATARAALLRSVQYDLTFRIEPRAREVRGSVWIRFAFADDRPPREPLVLDFAGEGLADVRVNDRPATLRAVANHLLVPPDLLGRGQNGITATFRSPIAASGTPLTVYRDPADGREYYYTLVVPADAHRLYPCFDQPDLRAAFTLVLDLPTDWTAVANTLPTPPEPTPRELLDAGLRRWTFAPTQPLPTYLMAFAAGPFDRIDAPPPPAPGIDPNSQLRIFLRASQRRHLDTDAVVDLHRSGLAWLAQDFGVPYPFGKLDTVLLPGFPYGGMEHAGAIFYRESALVFDHPPTTAERVRRSTLVYHELAHQWFGNLVTMKWFDDLWLKEGFATFAAHRCLEALEPGQQSWLRFLQRVKPRAYEVDGTPGTTPVFQSLQNLADAKSAYGPIVYNKAPAVLRELHARLGDGPFRKGLRDYLQRHAFGAAEWRDLAAALERSTLRDLGPWSQRWLLGASLPQVRVHWQSDAGGVVTTAVVQQRATLGEGTWPLDLELLVFEADGTRRTVRVVGADAELPIPPLVGQPAPRAILANPRDVAYGQFVPDAATRAFLLQHLPDEADPLLRAVGTGALFEAVREAELDPAQFAALALTLLARERDPDSHGALLDAFATCTNRYLTPERSAALRQSGTALLLRQLREESGSGRELTTFRHLVRLGSDAAVLDLCRSVCRGDELPKGLQPGKQDCFLAAAALLAAGAADERAALRARFATDDLGKELFLAGAAVPTAEAKQHYWQQYLAPEPPEQWTIDSLGWFHWPGQEALTLPYLQQALERAMWAKQNRRIFFLPAWFEGFVQAHSDAAALAVVDACLGTAELDADVRRKLQQSRDGLWRAVRCRATFSKRDD